MSEFLNRQIKVIYPTEAEEQATVCQYLDIKHLLYTHIANEGKRSVVAGRILKQQGMKKGVPDLIIFEPSGRYHGLAIEMKAMKGKASEEQLQWITDLNRRGYFAKVCHGAKEAIDLIKAYLNYQNTDRCICCGMPVTEGRQVCPECEAKAMKGIE